MLRANKTSEEIQDALSEIQDRMTEGVAGRQLNFKQPGKASHCFGLGHMSQVASSEARAARAPAAPKLRIAMLSSSRWWPADGASTSPAPVDSSETEEDEVAGAWQLAICPALNPAVDEARWLSLWQKIAIWQH